MRILLDTNIVVRNSNRTDVQHEQVAARLRQLVSDGVELCIAAQSIFEFWVVATRPVDVNGLGLSPSETRQKIEVILEAFSLLPDPQDLLSTWLNLCERHAVCGRPAHDARLVAWMVLHKIDRLQTLNPADFLRYGEIDCSGLA